MWLKRWGCWQQSCPVWATTPKQLELIQHKQQWKASIKCRSRRQDGIDCAHSGVSISLMAVVCYPLSFAHDRALGTAVNLHYVLEELYQRHLSFRKQYLCYYCYYCLTHFKNVERCLCPLILGLLLWTNIKIKITASSQSINGFG